MLQQVAGKVIRKASGELFVDSVRQETPVPRAAKVDVIPRAPTRLAVERGR